MAPQARLPEPRRAVPEPVLAPCDGVLRVAPRLRRHGSPCSHLSVLVCVRRLLVLGKPLALVPFLVIVLSLVLSCPLSPGCHLALLPSLYVLTARGRRVASPLQCLAPSECALSVCVCVCV